MNRSTEILTQPHTPGLLQVPPPTPSDYEILASDNYRAMAVTATTKASFARFNTAALWDDFAHEATARYLQS